MALFSPAERENSLRPWCVVLEPGTKNEYVEKTQHGTHRLAMVEVEHAKKVGINADVMYRLPDGTLTTEF